MFDTKGPTTRHAYFPQYKATRPPMPEGLVPQIPVIWDLVRAYRIPIIQQQGIEAAVGEGGGKTGRQQQGSRQQIKVEVGPIQAGMAAGQQGAQQRRRIGLLAEQAEQVEGARQIICGQSLA